MTGVPVRTAALAIALFLAALLAGCATTTPAPQTAPPPKPDELHGMASWYGEEFAGRTTANGEVFDPLLLTAAHRTLPFGTVVDVRNAKTGQTVRVRINDRGPFIANRIVDLSYAAAQKIGLIEPGTGEVELAIVSMGRGDREPPVPVDVTIAGTPAAATKSTTTSGEAPAVDFPLPNDVARSTAVVPPPKPAPTAATPRASSADADDASFTVQVVEEHQGAETRRQVSADGRKVENVSVAGGTSAAAPSNDAPAAPGHASAATAGQTGRSTPAVRPRVTAGYVVQVGAFSIEANAKSLQDRLTRIGQPSHIDHDELYRVRIGPFSTRDDAVKVRTALEANGVSAIVIAP